MGRVYTPIQSTTQTLPTPPSHLTQDELACWNEVVALLANANVLNSVDTDAIAVYCTAKVNFLRAKKEMDTLGVIIQSKQGYIKNPASSVLNESVRTMTQFFAQFGMTPSARAALKASDPNTGTDALTALLQANPLLNRVETRDEY